MIEGNQQVALKLATVSIRQGQASIVSEQSTKEINDQAF